MLPAWIRSRQALLTDIRNLTGWRNQLALELDNASDENAENTALKQQLATARVEIEAVKAERDGLRADLVEARRGDPLHKELQQANTQVTALEQALNRMQQTSMAADRPY